MTRRIDPRNGPIHRVSVRSTDSQKTEHNPWCTSAARDIQSTGLENSSPAISTIKTCVFCTLIVYVIKFKAYICTDVTNVTSELPIYKALPYNPVSRSFIWSKAKERCFKYNIVLIHSLLYFRDMLREKLSNLKVQYKNTATDSGCFIVQNLWPVDTTTVRRTYS